jgi:hypothetical protein
MSFNEFINYTLVLSGILLAGLFFIEIKKILQYYTIKIKAGNELIESNRAKSDLELITHFISNSVKWIKYQDEDSELNGVTIVSMVALAKRHRILLKPVIKILETSLKNNHNNEVDKVLKELNSTPNKEARSKSTA